MEEIKQLRYKGEFKEAFNKLTKVKERNVEYWIEYLLNSHYNNANIEMAIEELSKFDSEELNEYGHLIKAACRSYKIYNKTLYDKLESNLNNPFIVIGSDAKRRERMKERFQRYNLKADFVEGVKIEDDWKAFPYPGAIACRRAHLNAYKYFLSNYKNMKGAFFLEDDALLHKDFKERVCNIKLGDQILFSPIVWAQHNKRKYRGNLYHIGKYVASTCCYWISKNYMEKLLEKFDKPLKEYSKEYLTKPMDDILNDEGIGYFHYPPLAIEDGLSSIIEGLDYNSRYDTIWKRYNHNNYK